MLSYKKMQKKGGMGINKFVLTLCISFVLSLSTNLYALDIDYCLLGKPAPTFELAAVSEKQDGKVIKLSDYKGKIVLLNFWASWCGPCRAEMPTLTKLQDRYKKCKKRGDGYIYMFTN